MSDTVVFQKDGTYTRKHEVEKLDVQNVKPKTADTTLGVAAAPEAKTAAPSKPRPGTFSLDALRASAQKASAGVSHTTMPKSGSVPLDSVDVKATETGVSVESDPPAPTKTVKAPKKTSTPDTVKEAKTPKKTSTPDTVKGIEPVAPVAPEPPEVNTDPDSAATAKKVEPSAVGASEPKLEPISEMCLEAPETTIPQEEHIAPVATEPEPVAEVQVSTEPVPVPVPVVEKPMKAAGGFFILSLADFSGKSGRSQDSLRSWARTCVKASASFPGNVFESSKVKGLRFYNFIPQQSGAFVAALGFGDYLTCVRVDNTGVRVSDQASRLGAGSDVVTFDGEPFVLYAERERAARIITG